MKKAPTFFAETFFFFAIALASLNAAAAEPPTGNFSFKNLSDKSLGLLAGTQPVLIYNFGVLSKTGVPADRNRSTYFHPIYGLDGEILTDDFPKDHYHHRGLFWGWPHIKIEGQEYSTWDLRGIRQQFECWLFQQADTKAAFLGIENGWYVGPKKVLEEQVKLRVSQATEEGRILDLEFTWTPIGSPVTLAGAEGKSYGGFTLRFAPRKQTVITTPLGTDTNDLPITRLPWADLSAQFAGAQKPSGAAIFIAPDHPDYPPTWLTRHYGVLCVGWPGIQPATFKPGEPIRCRYRVWIHRGIPDQATLKTIAQQYATQKPITWPAVTN